MQITGLLTQVFLREKSTIMISGLSEKYIWTKLKDDNEYNIEMISLILMYGVSDRGFGDKYWKYDEAQMKKMLSIYNGDDDYGAEVYNCYLIFDKYN